MKEFTAVKRSAVIVKFIDVAMVCMSVCLPVCLSISEYVCVLLWVYSVNTNLYIMHIMLFPQHLSKLNSFNTLWAVVGAFLHFSIERLHQTWDEVPKAKESEKQ